MTTQPITLEEIKKAKQQSEVVEIDGVGGIQVNVMNLDQYIGFSEWQTEQDRSLAEQADKLVSLCCPVFSGEVPSAVLDPAPLLSLSVEIQRINGMTREEGTAKN